MRAEVDAVRHAVQHVQWSSLESDRDVVRHSAVQHQCAYFELAMIVESTTKAGLGSGKNSLCGKAMIVEKALRFLAKNKGILVDGYPATFAEAFAPQVKPCCRDACGLMLDGISRRPILDNTFEKKPVRGACGHQTTNAQRQA